MKSRSEIWLRALAELGAQCETSTTRDVTTFTGRVAQEGESFLTLTLPSFGKDFERCLALEEIPNDLFSGWGRLRPKLKAKASHVTENSSSGTPKFLGGFLDLVFTRGELVDPDYARKGIAAEFSAPKIIIPNDDEEAERIGKAIAAVRQLTLMFAKEKEPCSDSVNEAAIRQYVETDSALDDPLMDSRSSILFDKKRLESVKKVIRLVFGNAIGCVDGMIYHEQLIPKHGPGATADRLVGNQKWTLPIWHDRLEYLFPYGRYALPSYSYSWRYDQVKHVVPGEEQPVKITLVPKTQRSPRLIAIEPTCMQYIQQAISRELVRRLESDPVSSWFVGFSDQVRNNVMARKGSIDGSLATLDLSEASDRVANWLVEDLFADFPWFSEGIDACRSTRAMLPSGDVIHLKKFASMGSALTFPIEAIVFAAIVIERVLSSAGLPISRKNIISFRDEVRVYGDDIIVPTEYAQTVSDGLETFGFKVNQGKSFWTGRFRESCGKEYWNGIDVSIVKFRTKTPTSLHDASEVISTVSTRNQLYKAGLWKTAALLDTDLYKVLRGHYPIVSEDSPVLGRIDNSIPYDVHGFEPHTHSPFVRGFVESSVNPINSIDEEVALMKCLVESIGEPNIDNEHLTRSGRPRAVKLKLANASPF